MKVIRVLSLFLLLLFAAGEHQQLRGDEQCGVCGEVEGSSCNAFGCEFWYWHQLGYDDFIVKTFSGHGPHPDPLDGQCLDPGNHSSCSYSLNLRPGEVTSEFVLKLASERPQNVRYVVDRDVLQLTTCRDRVVAQLRPMGPLKALIGKVRAV